MKDIGRPSDFARPFGFQAEAGAQEGFGRMDAGTGMPGRQTQTGDLSAFARFGQMLDNAGAQMLSSGNAEPEADDNRAQSHGGGGPDQVRTGDMNDRVLLALSTMPSPQAPLSPFDVGFLNGTPPASSHAAALCDRIGVQVERALRAEFAPVAGRPMRVDIPPSDAVPGLDAFTLTVTPEAIEVVLIVNASTDRKPQALDAAADALADRLRTRFGKRMVRIFAQTVAAPNLAQDTKET